MVDANRQLPIARVFLVAWSGLVLAGVVLWFVFGPSWLRGVLTAVAAVNIAAWGWVSIQRAARIREFEPPREVRTLRVVSQPVGWRRLLEA